MSKNNKRLAVFPGTFDPVTNGHLDVIRRGVKLFDELIVAVGINPDKPPLLKPRQRVEIIRKALSNVPNVRVESFTGLTVDYVKKVGADAILRGIRNNVDLQFELQVALTNRVVAGVETVFILSSPEVAFISSGLIKQIARRGGDVSSMVPPEVLPHLRAAMKK